MRTPSQREHILFKPPFSESVSKTGSAVNSTVPEKPRTVRDLWIRMFIAFLVVQVLLMAFGVILASGGRQLNPDAVTRLDSMRQIFQTICALAVVACVAYVRARLNPIVVNSPQSLLRETAAAIAIGEGAVLLGLVGLARLHPDQFLIGGALVFVVDFALILPAGLRLMKQPAPPIEKSRGNKKQARSN